MTVFFHVMHAYSEYPIVINLERRCAKYIYLVNFIVNTIAKCSSVSNFRDNYRYLSYISQLYKYKIGNHVWDSPLCKLHKCFDSYMSHSITVFPEGSFIRDLCLMRDDYTVFNNCTITKEEFFCLFFVTICVPISITTCVSISFL